MPDTRTAGAEAAAPPGGPEAEGRAADLPMSLLAACGRVALQGVGGTRRVKREGKAPRIGGRGPAEVGGWPQVWGRGGGRGGVVEGVLFMWAVVLQL